MKMSSDIDDIGRIQGRLGENSLGIGDAEEINGCARKAWETKHSREIEREKGGKSYS